MCKVAEVNDIEELAEHRLLWNSLFAATPDASFFLTFDWLEAYWRHFGRQQKLKVLIVYAAGEPVGILPLCVRTEKYRLSKVRVLTYPLDDCGTWYGPIGPNPAATMLAAMQHIRTTPRDWDMIELRWVADEATQGGKTARALRIAGMLSEKRPYQTTSVVELPESWDAFVANKSRSLRSQFRRHLRHAFETKGAQYIRYRPAPQREGGGDPRWDVYAMCEAIAATSWQADATDGNTLTHDRVRNFYRDAHAAAARLGMLDMSLLKIDGRPAAFAYNYHHVGRVQGLRTGFDSAVSSSGAGSVLLLKTLEDSYARGDTHYDLGIGYHGYKRGFRTQEEVSYRFTHYRTGLLAQGVRLSRWVKQRIAAKPLAGGKSV